MATQKQFSTFTWAPKTVLISLKLFQNQRKESWTDLERIRDTSAGLNLKQGGSSAGAEEVCTNDVAFTGISREFAERGYIRMVQQCQAKVKSLKTKYMQIADRLRKNGEGHDSDEELEVPSDFSLFADKRAVMGSRISVTPVYLLDSANASDPSTSSKTSSPVPAEELAFLCLWRAELAHLIPLQA